MSMLNPIRRLRGLFVLGMSLTLGACSGSDGGTTFNPPPPPPPPPPPSGTIQLTQVFAGISLNEPLGMMQAPGDSSRWFVITKSGFAHVFDNDPNVDMRSPFLDLSAQVVTTSEAGLLGMAFDPDFGNGNFDVYMSYTRGIGGGAIESVVSRFSSTDMGQTLDPGTESIIMTVLQDEANHNGGQIAFGPDGFLYAGWGDGGGAGDTRDRAQNTSNVLGSITRIDVKGAAMPYGIPAGANGNPFATNAPCVQGFGGAPCPEIYAWGLRNPWRWSFDRQTGELWVGDVGQNQFEEVDRVELGMNYGWRCREGAHDFNTVGCNDTYVDPITEYGHGTGFSVTGGYVYRGTAIPSLVGQYVFGDFVTGRIWTVPANSPQGTERTDLLDTPLSIASFAEGNDGELYVLDFAGGAIYQIVLQ